MKLKKKIKSIDNKQKLLNIFEKEQAGTLSKKELAKLKTAYKNGTLKFDPREIAEAILEEHKKGITK